jgi:hypothetical protein
MLVRSGSGSQRTAVQSLAADVLNHVAAAAVRPVSCWQLHHPAFAAATTYHAPPLSAHSLQVSRRQRVHDGSQALEPYITLLPCPPAPAAWWQLCSDVSAGGSAAFKRHTRGTRCKVPDIQGSAGARVGRACMQGVHMPRASQTRTHARARTRTHTPPQAPAVSLPGDHTPTSSTIRCWQPMQRPCSPVSSLAGVWQHGGWGHQHPSSTGGICGTGTASWRTQPSAEMAAAAAGGGCGCSRARAATTARTVGRRPGWASW